ncbi:MBL fold metallo-hydrolase [Pseudolysinimonas kribbensis]|uniref:MBL fold metallo-hydrolase n=1 Tax=Pseudolysinimonas kribbensis TaxID=433641 RepID=A0ABQ6KD57_9MICO|nr:MBL fold metallo-hydrolase [Pseudolysinimonas kribbensis]GMA96366.1 MBL fold metallo-hydrolase [Pseudolysinimonas kribbensis]
MSTDTVTVTLIGGPTLLIEVAGIRILTDPTFDPPGEYPSGPSVLVKTTGPALTPEQVGAVDVVLLSHDQHPDNLDAAGRAFLATVPLVVTTTAAAERLGGSAVGVEPWRRTETSLPDGRTLTIGAVPAQHGPDGFAASSGPVIGFVLSGEGIPTTYVSGDNAAVRVVEEVVDNQGPIEVAVLFGGGARTRRLDAYLTLRADQAVRAARLLDARAIVLVHAEGWRHFSQGQADFADAFAAAGRSELVVLAPGERRVL